MRQSITASAPTPLLCRPRGVPATLVPGADTPGTHCIATTTKTSFLEARQPKPSPAVQRKEVAPTSYRSRVAPFGDEHPPEFLGPSFSADLLQLYATFETSIAFHAQSPKYGCLVPSAVMLALPGLSSALSSDLGGVLGSAVLLRHLAPHLDLLRMVAAFDLFIRGSVPSRQRLAQARCGVGTSS